MRDDCNKKVLKWNSRDIKYIIWEVRNQNFCQGSEETKQDHGIYNTIVWTGRKKKKQDIENVCHV